MLSRPVINKYLSTKKKKHWATGLENSTVKLVVPKNAGQKQQKIKQQKQETKQQQTKL